MNSGVIGTVLTALAYVVGGIAFWKFSLSRGFKKEHLKWILAGSLIGGIFGAKATSLLLSILHGASPADLLAHPDGRSIIGGILFGWLGVELAKKKLKITRSTGDGFAFALSIGEAIGRIGCFFAGCCYGEICTLPWAVFQHDAMRHPTQLYSAALALFVFLFLLFMKNKVKYEGDLFRIYLLFYGVGRFCMEFFRVRSEVYFGLSVAQWVSIEITAAMTLALIWTYTHKNPPAEDGANETM